MDYLEYKDYRGSVEYSAEDRCLHGKVAGIDDLITYEANNVDDLEQEFRASVDDYLELCGSLGRKPDRAYPGKVLVRMTEDLHRRLACQAELESKSLNRWIVNELERIASRRQRPRV